MGKIKLLIIDEHHAVRTALGVRLRSAIDIEVLATANDVEEGLAQIEAGQPDVVLFGLKSIRRRDLGATIDAVANLSSLGVPVVVLTSYADDIERELLAQAGARRYLLKDINSAQLIGEIRATVSEHEAETKPTS